MSDVYSDEQTVAYVESIAHLADGVRVRVLSARCLRCGEEEVPFEPGDAWTVSAAVLREIAQLAHTDDCPGPIQWETEPA